MQCSASYARIHFSSFLNLAQVKLCESTSGGLFAVKICRCSFLGSSTRAGARRMSTSGQDKLQALKKEISIMKRLDHPNIVKLHHVLEDTEKGRVCRCNPRILVTMHSLSIVLLTSVQMYLVMDYVAGGSVTDSMTDANGLLRSLDEATTRMCVFDSVGCHVTQTGVQPACSQILTLFVAT